LKIDDSDSALALFRFGPRRRLSVCNEEHLPRKYARPAFFLSKSRNAEQCPTRISKSKSISFPPPRSNRRKHCPREFWRPPKPPTGFLGTPNSGRWLVLRNVSPEACAPEAADGGASGPEKHKTLFGAACSLE
jgi:hypothetical protein